MFADTSTTPVEVRPISPWVRVRRRGPLLIPSSESASPGIYGVDLTLGCGHFCRWCHVREAPAPMGRGRLLYDPRLAERLVDRLDSLAETPRAVCLSPRSDPFPPSREIVRVAEEVLNVLLEREIPVIVMTRGRIPRRLIESLAARSHLVRFAIGLSTLNRSISETLEPGAATPRARLRNVKRVLQAGLTCELRLEPLIPDWTDTRENLIPVFAALRELGVRELITHYLFLHPAMQEPFQAAIEPLGWKERLDDLYRGGPVFTLGSAGATKHLPLEARRTRLARVVAWAAEQGLSIRTGTAQNPDLSSHPHKRILAQTQTTTAETANRATRHSTVRHPPRRGTWKAASIGCDLASSRASHERRGREAETPAHSTG
mgnify:CR=1 FL=1